jgi:hypothetical protein
MSSQPKTDPETLEFFVVLHQVLSSHPDNKLVNSLHRLRNAPGVQRAYTEAAWVMVGREEA